MDGGPGERLTELGQRREQQVERQHRPGPSGSEDGQHHIGSRPVPATDPCQQVGVKGGQASGGRAGVSHGVSSKFQNEPVSGCNFNQLIDGPGVQVPAVYVTVSGCVIKRGHRNDRVDALESGPGAASKDQLDMIQLRLSRELSECSQDSRVVREAFELVEAVHEQPDRTRVAGKRAGDLPLPNVECVPAASVRPLEPFRGFRKRRSRSNWARSVRANAGAEESAAANAIACTNASGTSSASVGGRRSAAASVDFPVPAPPITATTREARAASTTASAAKAT